MSSQEENINLILKHGGRKLNLAQTEDLREYVKEMDIVLRNSKSGSVPGLEQILTPEQRAQLVEDVFPHELEDDEKTMWYLGKLNDIMSCSIIPIEKYISNKKYIRHKCIICGYEVDAPPSRIETNAKKNRRGCDGCNHRNGTSLEDARRLFRYKNPDVIPLEGFKTQKDPLRVRCNTCGHEWESKPHYLLLDGPSRTGCPECGKKAVRKTGNQRKTTAGFRDQLAAISPDITLLGEYVNTKTKIRVQHSCGYEWEAKPYKLLKGQGCPRCNKPHRMSHEEYLQRLSDENIEYEPLGTFSGVDTKIPHLCPECGEVWDISPYNVLLGYGCPACRAGRVKYSMSEFIEAIHAIDPFVDPLEEFKGMQRHVRFHCNRDGYEWSAIPYNILNPSENKKHRDVCCPMCLHKIPRVSEEDVRQQVASIHKNISLISGYHGISQKAKFRCSNHKVPYEWEAFVNNILRGTGCPVCNTRSSFPEKALFYYLSRDCMTTVLINPKIELVGGDLRFEADLFIPEWGTFVEYDGVYWHDNEYVMERYKKREEAIFDAGLRCVHILEENKNGEKADGNWIVEPPIIVDAAHASSIYRRKGLDSAIRQLETRLGIHPRDEISCHADTLNIEEFFDVNCADNRVKIENGIVTAI